VSDKVFSEENSFWSGLSEKDRLEIRSAMVVRRVAGGETLIEQGSLAQAMFIVNFGRFEVRNFARQAIAEVGAGQLIGEIGFFAGEPRTASVVAARDSEVLEINRAQFDALAARIPEIQRSVTRALAKRLVHLASIIRDNESATTLSTPRVVAVVAAGSGEMPGDFIARLREALATRGRTCFLTSENAVPVSQGSATRYELANWLSGIELKHDLVVCVADPALTTWTHAVLRSADQILLVAAGSPDTLNPVESLAMEIFPKARRRLVRVEIRRSACAPPSKPWLRRREVFMIHHLSMQDQDDFHSLWRFLTGQAIGLVAGGGGAFGASHIGIFKAFQEAGVAFDIFGGSSVGSAVAAGFACLTDAEVFKAAMHDMFVRRRALSRFTLPRYGLLDHRTFEDELQRKNPGDIEDLWKPFFAVATDLSTDTLRVMREGPLWQAIRASCSIPGVLPPFIDDAGHMLVDGGVRDNLPVGVMNSLKSGPNLVIDLQPPKRQLFNFSYRAIPGRGELIRHMLNPWPWKKALPVAPKSVSDVLGPWLAEHVAQNRNMVRFLLPKADSPNFYDDRNLLITARCALLASEWKQTDQHYSKLHGKFEAALKAELKNRFDRYALLTTWDFQTPKNCTFTEEAHGVMGADIPAAVEKHVAANHFAPEDFEAFIIQAAGRNDTMRRILALLREPPLPGKTVIPFLGDVNIYDQVLRVVAKDKIALNAAGRWWHKEPGESTEDALVRLRQGAWYSGQAMFAVQLGETSQVGSGGVVVTPPIPTPPLPVPPGPISQPEPLPPNPPIGGGPTPPLRVGGVQPLPVTHLAQPIFAVQGRPVDHGVDRSKVAGADAATVYLEIRPQTVSRRTRFSASGLSLSL